MNYSVEEDIVKTIFERIKHFIVPSENNGYKSKFLQSNLLLYFVVLIFVFKIFITLVSINLPQNIFFADIAKSALESFVNQTRESNGLKPLAESAKLNQAAQLKAENMVANNYFNHTSPSGISPWYWFTKVGYNYKYAGENLAIGFFDSQEVYQAWLNSPEHRANIVNPNYTEVGTAVLSGFGSNNTIVVVQEFGSQKTAVKPTTVATKTTIITQTQKSNVKVSTDKNSSATVNNKTTPTQNANTSTKEKVLSQSTESQDSIKPATTNGINNLSSKLLNSVLYSYNGLLQNILYGISMIITGILLTLIFFSFNINFKKQLVFRAVLIMVLLSVATLINKEIIIAFIPHQIFI